MIHLNANTYNNMAAAVLPGTPGFVIEQYATLAERQMMSRLFAESGASCCALSRIFPEV